MEKKTKAFGELLEIMERLRRECPWDRKQTMESLRPMTIEETYELCDAVMAGDMNDVKKELGDLLMHITFYASIAEEKGLFSIQDVAEGICAKLKYRHPHIYGDVKVENADDVRNNWEKLKLTENGRKHKVLEGVPVSLPALVKAFRLQEKAAGVGFDWESGEEVWAKVKEETMEVENEMASHDASHLEDEFGDLLFAMVNVMRKFGVNPDNALEKTNRKFLRRFGYVEDNAPRSLADMTLEEMDALWNEAKKRGL